MWMKGDVDTLFDKGTQEQILPTVRAVASRLFNPEEARRIGADPRNAIAIQGMTVVPWHDLSLSHGYPGLAMLFAELDRCFPDEGWDHVALRYFQALKVSLEQTGIHSLSMFSGVCGVALPVFAASRNLTRYQTLLQRLEEQLLDLWPGCFATLLAETGTGATMQRYDVIEGSTGVGRYLLLRRENPRLQFLLDDVLAYLVRLTEPVTVDGYVVPGWYISVERQFLDSDRSQFPHGNFNCGMAHGVAGPLSLLSLAYSAGVRVEGQRDAIERMSQWLVRAQRVDQWGVYWPSHVDWFEESRITPIPAETESHHRAAWCYGTPGVVRSLWLAGRALGEPRMEAAAVDALVECLRRPEDTWQIPAATLCHGKAGLMQIVWRMWCDTHDERLKTAVARLAHIVLAHHDPAAPFGYRDLEPRNGMLNSVDKPGLLDGAAGVAMALLSLESPTEPIWDKAFLLA